MKKLLILLLILLSFNSTAQTCDSLKKKYDSLLITSIQTHKKDSLKLKAANFRLNRIKFYMKLVDKDPSQMRYLRTWIRRPLQ